MTNKTPGAVFLDRDGTFIVDKNYLSRIEDIEYYPDTFEALRLLRAKGYRLFVVTNQSGVGRGFFDLSRVHEIHATIDADLRSQGLPPFDGWAICPHTPEDDCACRKPKPELIATILEREHLDRARCWMIGDKAIDAECGLNAGISGACVRDRGEATPAPRFPDLLAFARALAE